MVIDVIKDLRGEFGPARNQGSRPTCVAFATSDAHAFARGQIDQLSVEHLYYHAVLRTAGGHPDDGVSLKTILTALRHDGQTAELGWPYLASVDLAAWRPPTSATPIFRRAAMTGTDAVDVVCTHLDAGEPVVLVFLASEAFYLPDPEGFIIAPSPDPDVDYHAILAVGYGALAGHRYVLVRNSWGDSWGLAGHAWVPATYLDPRLIGTATTKEEIV